MELPPNLKQTTINTNSLNNFLNGLENHGEIICEKAKESSLGEFNRKVDANNETTAKQERPSSPQDEQTQTSRKNANTELYFFVKIFVLVIIASIIIYVMRKQKKEQISQKERHYSYRSDSAYRRIINNSLESNLKGFMEVILLLFGLWIIVYISKNILKECGKSME